MDNLDYERSLSMKRTEKELFSGTELVRMGMPIKVLHNVDPKKDNLIGLRTIGISTCTAIGGYFFDSDSRPSIFLVHLAPPPHIEGIIPTFKEFNIKELYYSIVSGSRVNLKFYDKSGGFEQGSLEEALKKNGINARTVPFNKIKEVLFVKGKYYTNEGLGCVIRMERKGENWLPTLTVIKEN